MDTKRTFLPILLLLVFIVGCASPNPVESNSVANTTPILNSMIDTSNQTTQFESGIRKGNICSGSLAILHNFSVFLSNQDKTGFVTLDRKRTIGQMLSLAWSPDGQHLAVVGNTTGTGNVYFTDSIGNQLQPVFSDSSGLGYLRGAAWSHDGKRLLMWSSQNNTIIYFVEVGDAVLTDYQLDMYMSSTPLFAPGKESIIVYGSDSSLFGLFEIMLDSSQTKTISNLVENLDGFAESPDGSRLAYIETDRKLGEVRLIVEEFDSGSKAVIATLPIPKRSGSYIPEAANLNWLPEGNALVFDFGNKDAPSRAIYLAYADGTGLIKLADSGHAPAISADGRCLAFISNKQVFLLDLSSVSLNSPAATSTFLAELPAGRGSGGDIMRNEESQEPFCKFS